MEKHDYSLAMQEEMAGEIERSQPNFIVFVGIPTSWLVRPESERFIFRWTDTYLQQHYDLIGFADIHAAETVCRWYKDAQSYNPQSKANLFIFQRR
jgi:hypothetical protein